ncbi:PREDICTED: DNA repair protein RAD9-like [Ceratosolen solmsi marchali]|uniref:DNA repair protein RAD9-like n=1 Tax=Ceratosolen solmsi marchali TaxID=326594 RepID=A0AAJ6VL61_9HYME|nr:PREDICTED: DNA repair protein RAD9-like [Ceratosolen solmsi marchali]
MNKTPEANIANNSSGLVTEENQQKLAYLLTQKVDEEIESQMKKIEVQKMEDDLTIKMLEREYSESKRNFIYTKKKLDETRKKASTQSETINQLSQANKAIVEKFNELKRFQNEFILVNIDNAETTSNNCLNKNNVLSNTLRMITEKENYTKFFNYIVIYTMLAKRELEEKKAVNDNLDQILTQSKRKLETLKMELTQEKIDINFDELIQENKNRMMQLEMDDEVFQAQFKQETDDLTQQKNNKIQVTMKREINELSKKVFDENIINIKNEQNKINIELEAAKAKFSKDENDMHTEFNSLLSRLEKKKKLLKKIESYEQDLSKLKETTKSTKEKLESFKHEENTVENTVANSNDSNTKNSPINKKPSNSQKKLIYSKNDNECESKELDISPESTNKKKIPKSPNKSIYSFNLFDTDESDDEMNLKTILPETNDNNSHSEELFDNLLSQKDSKSSKTSKDTDLFKMPHAYMTPFRKKPSQTKKCFSN